MNKKNKILVTGGAGYIGSHAVYALIERGYRVVIVDSLWRGFVENIHPEAKLYKFDIRNEEKLKELFKKEKNIIGIMHFAGSIIVSESVEKPLDYFNNNVGSVESLLRVAQKYNVKNIVFSSTAAVYGNVARPIKETDITKPVNPYGESKLAAEALIRGWAKATNSKYVIFRYFNVAGAHESEKLGIRGKELTHLLPSILETALKKRDLFEIFGNNYNTKDGSCIRDFLHVNDLVSAHILGLEWSIKNNESSIFNLGSGSGYSVIEVLNEVEKVLNLKINSKVINRRKGDPAIVYANVTKANKILNWKTKIKLDEIIKSDYNFRKLYEKKNNI